MYKDEHSNTCYIKTPIYCEDQTKKLEKFEKNMIKRRTRMEFFSDVSQMYTRINVK